MPELSGRTENFTDSVIRRMTRVSLQYGAVNLSQGFPDFDPPKEILNRFAEVAHEDYHQYSITWGAQNFREALAEKQSKFMGRSIDPNSEIVVTCGSTEAMMAAMMTVTDPGDKVIVFSPFYENYGTDAILSGAQPIYVPLYPPEFDFNPDELEAAFKQHPKALILCNPSNPCGKVFTYNELKFIADLAENMILCHHGRGLRAHSLCAEQACVFCHSPRNVGAHDFLLVAVKDIFDNRLAAGLYYRTVEYH